MFVFFVPLSAENSVTGTDRKSLFDAGETKFRFLVTAKNMFFFLQELSCHCQKEVFFPTQLMYKILALLLITF